MAPEKETKNNGKGAKGKNSKRKRPITSGKLIYLFFIRLCPQL